jgi:hypothetical protein
VYLDEMGGFQEGLDETDLDEVGLDEMGVDELGLDEVGGGPFITICCCESPKRFTAGRLRRTRF